MPPLKKAGIKESLTKEEMVLRIRELENRSYERQLRNHMMSQSQVAKSRVQAAEKERSEEERPQSVDGEEQKALKERQQSDLQKKQEEERLKRELRKRRIDEYEVLLQIDFESVKEFQQDLWVHVDRVCNKIPFESTTYLGVPWNQLSSKVRYAHAERDQRHLQQRQGAGRDLHGQHHEARRSPAPQQTRQVQRRRHCLCLIIILTQPSSQTPSEESGCLLRWQPN